MDALRLALTALLVSALPGLAPRAGGEPPAAAPSPRPITDSVEKVIDRLEEERKDPCLKAARENIPCFPVKTEEKGFDASVRESLGIRGPAEKPGPDRPPTRDEMGPYRPTPAQPLISKTVDPVCIGKSALKKLKGKNDVYYLYRVRDVHGERVVLYDHRLDASRFQGDIAFLGRFDGECEAQAAYRREQRRMKPEASPPPPGVQHEGEQQGGRRPHEPAGSARGVCHRERGDRITAPTAGYCVAPWMEEGRP